jgi:type 1 glutamine amidotransferase
MSTVRFAVLLGLGLLLLAGPVGGAQPPQRPKRSDVERVLATARDKLPPRATERRLTVVLLADRKDHGPEEHDYPRWQARWALLLGGSAASKEPAANLYGPDAPHPLLAKGAPNVRVVSAQTWPDAKQWDAADLVVAFCYLAWDPARIEQISKYLERGGGLVVVHSATWTTPKPSAEVAKVLGVGGFERWRHGALTLERTQVEHPICLGLPSTLRLEDESYWPPTPPLDRGHVQVLAGSKESNPGQAAAVQEPMFWTFERGKGRVFGCVPGHYNWTFDDPVFRLWLLRGMAWAAGESPYRFDDLALRSAAVEP